MSQKVTVYTFETCPYCVRAKQLLEARGIQYEEHQISPDDDQKRQELYDRSGMRTVPQIFFEQRLIGGYTDLADLNKKDQLESLK